MVVEKRWCLKMIANIEGKNNEPRIAGKNKLDNL